MGLRTQQLKGLNGGLNAVAQDLEGLEGPTQSPDLLNCYGLPGTVFSRLGSAPWWDTGGTGPLYWFSFFEPLKLGDGSGGGTTIDGDTPYWHWPTAPTYPGPVPRSSSYLFRILTPANGTLGVDPDAQLHITWERRRGALGYKLQVKDADTGTEALIYPDCPTPGYYVPAGTFARSKSYVIKVWAILDKSPEGAATQLEQTTNTRTFNTLLTVPTNLAPVGEIATLTPTFTCDAVAKAVRYKVRIYAADSVTVLHTSIALLLPSYVIAGGVLTSGSTYYWSYTAYADAACTAAYGVESGHEVLTPLVVPVSNLYRITFQPESGTEDWLGWNGDYTAQVNGSRSSFPDRYHWENSAYSPRFFFTILDSTPAVITFGAQNIPGTDHTGSPNAAPGIQHMTDGSTHWLEGSFFFRTLAPGLGYPLYKLEIINGA